MSDIFYDFFRCILPLNVILKYSFPVVFKNEYSTIFFLFLEATPKPDWHNQPVNAGKDSNYPVPASCVKKASEYSNFRFFLALVRFFSFTFFACCWNPQDEDLLVFCFFVVSPLKTRTELRKKYPALTQNPNP